MRKITFLALLAALVLPLGFGACSSDDDKDDGSGQTTTKTSEWDDLDYFQHVITDLDTLGNLRGYHYGKQLYKDTDPGHLYIGVDTWDEAEEFFREWLANDVTVSKISSGGSDLQAELTDTLGNKQLTVYLKAASSSTNVAECTVSDESKLKHFYQITFILNSAWPQNEKSSSHWRKGDILREGYAVGIEEWLDESDFPLNWVCIRKGSNGTRPIFMAITNHDGYVGGDAWTRPTYTEIKNSRYSPGKQMAKSLLEKISADSLYFEAVFKEYGCGVLDQEAWVGAEDHGSDVWYNFFTGETDSHGSWAGIGSSNAYALYFDWYDDDEIHDDMSIDEDYNKEDDD